ncbi:hypothetical protein ACLOJK_040570 [Asimina triloba]
MPVGHALLDRCWTWEWKGTAASTRWDAAQAAIDDLKNRVLPIYCRQSLVLWPPGCVTANAMDFERALPMIWRCRICSSWIDGGGGSAGAVVDGGACQSGLGKKLLPQLSTLELSEMEEAAAVEVDPCSARRRRSTERLRFTVGESQVAVLAGSDGVAKFDVVVAVVNEDDGGIEIGSSSPCFWVAWICKRMLPEELTAGSPLMKVMEHHNRCSGSALNSGAPAV